MLRVSRREALLLAGVYLLSLALRLLPKLATDEHLPVFQADVWYRIAMAQYVLDHHELPEPDLRYRAYGYVPMWYPPLSQVLLAAGAALTGLQIPVLCTRVLPFLEALTPLSIYFLTRHLAGRRSAAAALLVLALTPSFIYWTAIADPQSFTLFMLPLYLLYWHHVAGMEARQRLRSLLPLGVLLGVNFLLHLSYFLVLLVMLMYTLGMLLQGARRTLMLDFLVVVLISQAVAAPWWLPRNLYWWWIEALVTSSGLYSGVQHLREYGMAAALAGGAGMLYLLRTPRASAPLLLWALPLLLETQNEAILQLLGMQHLTWETLAKPLEGFRFYPFLAQPAAVAAGVLLGRVWRYRVLILVLLLMGAELWAYGLDERLSLTGITPEEYRAAVWYRENSDESSRIIADYYRAQMLAGVAGGRALLGGVFPLRSVGYPYISVPAVVQDDLYLLYSTTSPELAWSIARKYNATHIYYSVWMRTSGNLLSSRKPPTSFGVEVYLPKFYNTTYFRRVYASPGVSIFYVMPEQRK